MEEQEVIIKNNDLLFHFTDHGNDLLVLKHWKGAFNRIVSLLLSHLKNNDLALLTQSLFLKRPRSSDVILYKINDKIEQLFGVVMMPFSSSK